MKKYILSFSILVLSITFLFVLINNVKVEGSSPSSTALSNLTYPITELGNCKDQADCKTYCDDTANTNACLNYAEKKSLLSEEEIKIAKKFVASGSKGPGSCKGKDECQNYCEDKAHIDECVSYSEENDLMSQDELQKAKKVQAAIKKGVKFPACANKKECDTYCEESSHMEECITFAQEAGLLSKEELKNTQKILTAVKQGVKLPACKGKDDCDKYCAEESNREECTNFAVAAGLVTVEEAKIIKETGRKGPGGCKSKEECDSYCSNSENKEACLNFTIEHNLISEDQLEKMKRGGAVPEGQGGPNNQRGPSGQGGPGNNGGNMGQSGWSNGTGNGGGNGGPDSQFGPGMKGPGGQGGPGDQEGPEL
jgi:Zn ribbon nucleic-acid-binding protein